MAIPATDWTPQTVPTTFWQDGAFTSNSYLLLQSGTTNGLLLQNGTDLLGLQID